MRYKSLDSLRGIAAATVVAHHVFLTFPFATDPINIKSLGAWEHLSTWLRYSPLRFFVGGRPAVVIFFVLSGFVLAASLNSARKSSYFAYLFKRFTRIYLPFLASFFIAAALFILAAPVRIEQLSSWFNDKSWYLGLDSSVIASYLTLDGQLPGQSLNNVIWTLGHELRISAIFPIIVFVLLRFNVRGFAALSVFSLVCYVLLFKLDRYTPLGSLIESAYYSLYFTLGAAVFLQAGRLRDMLISLKLRSAAAFLFVMFCFLSVPPGVPFAEILYGLSAAAFIISAISHRVFTSVLETRFFTWLGERSFSLYLVHLPILLASLQIGVRHDVPVAIIVIAAVATAVAASELMFRGIERPSMALGRAVADRIDMQRRLAP